MSANSIGTKYGKKLCIKCDASAPKTSAHMHGRPAYGSDIGAKPRVKCSQMKTLRSAVRPVQGQRDSTISHSVFIAHYLLPHYIVLSLSHPISQPIVGAASIFDLVSLRHFSPSHPYHCELSERPHSLITCCSVFRTIKLFGISFLITPKTGRQPIDKLSIELFNYQPNDTYHSSVARKRSRNGDVTGRPGIGRRGAHSIERFSG